MLGRGACDKKLRAISVLAAIGHGEDAGAAVLQLGVDLVGKFVPIDRGPAPPSRTVSAKKPKKKTIGGKSE